MLNDSKLHNKLCLLENIHAAGRRYKLMSFSCNIIYNNKQFLPLFYLR